MRLFLLLVEEKISGINSNNIFGAHARIAFANDDNNVDNPLGGIFASPTSDLSQQQEKAARLPQQLHSSGVQGFSGLRHCPIKAGSISGCVWNFPNGV
jgi:hypothetical protein